MDHEGAEVKKRGFYYQKNDRDCVVVPEDGGRPFSGRIPTRGEPLLPGQTLVALAHDDDGGVEYEPVVRMEANGNATSLSGPAQVATEAYRQGWGRIFGRESN